jgi:hypothetical protein
MKILIIFSIFACSLSLKCSNCKHFIKDTKPNMFVFAKCKMFTKTKDVYSYSIRDKKETRKTIEDMYYCSTAREFTHMCGVEGKWYQLK